MLAFFISFVGLSVLAAAGFIFGRIVFLNNPGIENVFSTLWTVVLGVLLYLMVRQAAKPAATPAERRRAVYGFILSLCELFAFATLIFVAVVFSTFATTPGNEQVLTLILCTGVLAVLMVASTRVIHLLANRHLAAERN
jgi:phosphatidylserine synthase